MITLPTIISQRWLYFYFSLMALLTSLSWHCSANESVKAEPDSVKPHIRFVCTAPPNSHAFLLAEQIFSQAFNDWGYSFELVYLPYLRAVAELSNGNIDGDCGRVDHPAFRTNPNIIYLDVTIIQMATYLWYYDGRFANWSPDAPSADIPRIATLRGIIWAEDKISDWGNMQKMYVSDVDQGLKMLQTQRADLLIAADYFVQTSDFIQTGGTLPNRGQQVGHFALYPLLNIRHKALAKPLTEHLNKLLADPDHPLNKITSQLKQQH